MSQTNPPRCPFEHIQDPDLEAKQIAETTELTVKLLDKRYPSPTQILRGVHPKAHGCVKATFTINTDIAPELQVGLFAEPGKQFDAFIRFSNAAALVGPDTIEIDPVTKNEVEEHGSRGMAIKVLDVGGEVLIDDNGAHNQDFLMINQPVFAFANIEDYLRLDRVLDRDNDVAAGFFAPLQLNNPNITEEQKRRILAYMEAEDISEEDIKRIARSFSIIKEDIQVTDVGNPLGIQYFSAAPFLFGPDRVMKFSAMPCTEVPPAHSPSKPRPENYLREALIETMGQNEELHFDFMLQVRSEGEDLGIEDASSKWDEREYPFINVAKITISRPQLEVDFDENKVHCEKLAFTPWHSQVEHQPIGSINRLRKSVYQASAAHRLNLPESGEVGLLGKILKFFFG
ncbi:MAG TPA: catalase family protein [Methylobacter sp.]|jgi:hypothetical protein